MKTLTLANSDGKTLASVPQEKLQELMEAGYTPVSGQTITLPSGKEVPSEKYIDVMSRHPGAKFALAGAEFFDKQEAEKEYGGLGGALKAYGYGALHPLGGFAIDAGLTTPKALRQIELAQPGAVTAGEWTGLPLASLGIGALTAATGGAPLVAGGLATAGTLAEAAAPTVVRSLGRQVLGSAAENAAIGAGFGAGEAYSQARVDERDVTSGDILEGAKGGAIGGAVIGGAIPLVGKVYSAVKGKYLAAKDARAATLADEQAIRDGVDITGMTSQEARIARAKAVEQSRANAADANVLAQAEAIQKRADAAAAMDAKKTAIRANATKDAADVTELVAKREAAISDIGEAQAGIRKTQPLDVSIERARKHADDAVVAANEVLTVQGSISNERRLAKAAYGESLSKQSLAVQEAATDIAETRAIAEHARASKVVNEANSFNLADDHPDRVKAVADLSAASAEIANVGENRKTLAQLRASGDNVANTRKQIADLTTAQRETAAAATQSVKEANATQALAFRTKREEERIAGLKAKRDASFEEKTRAAEKTREIQQQKQDKQYDSAQEKAAKDHAAEQIRADKQYKSDVAAYNKEVARVTNKNASSQQKFADRRARAEEAYDRASDLVNKKNADDVARYNRDRERKSAADNLKLDAAKQLVVKEGQTRAKVAGDIKTAEARLSEAVRANIERASEGKARVDTLTAKAGVLDAKRSLRTTEKTLADAEHEVQRLTAQASRETDKSVRLGQKANVAETAARIADIKAGGVVASAGAAEPAAVAQAAPALTPQEIAIDAAATRDRATKRRKHFVSTQEVEAVAPDVPKPTAQIQEKYWGIAAALENSTGAETKDILADLFYAAGELKSKEYGRAISTVIDTTLLGKESVTAAELAYAVELMYAHGNAGRIELGNAVSNNRKTIGALNTQLKRLVPDTGVLHGIKDTAKTEAANALEFAQQRALGQKPAMEVLARYRRKIPELVVQEVESAFIPPKNLSKPSIPTPVLEAVGTANITGQKAANLSQQAEQSTARSTLLNNAQEHASNMLPMLQQVRGQLEAELAVSKTEWDKATVDLTSAIAKRNAAGNEARVAQLTENIGRLEAKKTSLETNAKLLTERVKGIERLVEANQPAALVERPMPTRPANLAQPNVLPMPEAPVEPGAIPQPATLARPAPIEASVVVEGPAPAARTVRGIPDTALSPAYVSGTTQSTLADDLASATSSLEKNKARSLAETIDETQLSRDALRDSKANRSLAQANEKSASASERSSRSKQNVQNVTATTAKNTKLTADIKRLMTDKAGYETALNTYASGGKKVTATGLGGKLVPYSEEVLFQNQMKALRGTPEGKELIAAINYVAPNIKPEAIATSTFMEMALGSGVTHAITGGALMPAMVGMFLGARGGRAARLAAAVGLNPLPFLWTADAILGGLVAGRGNLMSLKTGARMLTTRQDSVMAPKQADEYVETILRDREAINRTLDTLRGLPHIDYRQIEPARAKMDEALNYLESKRPPKGVTTGAEAVAFARAVSIMKTPTLLAKFVKDGTVTRADADVMKLVSPESYARVQEGIALLHEKDPTQAELLAAMFSVKNRSGKKRPQRSMNLSLLQTMSNPLANNSGTNGGIAAAGRPPSESKLVENNKPE